MLFVWSVMHGVVTFACCRMEPEQSVSGTKLYRPSDTFALVQQEDSLREPLSENGHRPAAVRAYSPSSAATTATTTNRVNRLG